MRTLSLASVTIVGLVAVSASPFAASKPGTYSPVPLSVTIEGVQSDLLSPTRVTGDDSPYVNGQGGTTANLDKYGNLIVSFGRPVCFDYGGVGYAPSGCYNNSYISTVPKQSEGGALQNLTEGSSQCIQLNWQFRDGSNVLWRNGFHRDRDLPSQDGTSYAVVTRTGADEWEVEPRAFSCLLYDNPAGIARVFTHEFVRGTTVYTDYGLYSLPFRLTLTRQ
jgi:hypothetical protein